MPDRPLDELRDLVEETRTTVKGLTVEPGKVAEFAGAVRDDARRYRDPAAAAREGFAAVPAPPTFTRVSYFPRYRPGGVDEWLGFDLGFREERVVHGEQAYRYERPVVVGETLSATTTLERVYRRAGEDGRALTFAVFRTDFRDEDGGVVQVERTTRIEVPPTDGARDDGDATETGGGEGAMERAGEGATAETASERAPGRSTDPAQSDDTATGDATRVDPATVAAGDPAPTRVFEDVGREAFVRYAGASGDFNRIHYDGPYAAAAGHPGVFGQGMLTAGFVAAVATDWLGLGGLERFRTRFLAPVRPGDSLVVEGAVSEVDRGDDVVVEADLRARNDAGDQVAASSVTADASDDGRARDAAGE